MDVKSTNWSNRWVFAEVRRLRAEDSWIKPFADFNASEAIRASKERCHNREVNRKELIVRELSVLILEFTNRDLALPRIDQQAVDLTPLLAFAVVIAKPRRSDVSWVTASKLLRPKPLVAHALRSAAASALLLDPSGSLELHLAGVDRT